MKVVFRNEWFDGERRWRKSSEQQDVPNDLKDRLPKTAKVVSDEYMAPFESDEWAEDPAPAEPSIRDFDESRQHSDAFGDLFNMVTEPAQKLMFDNNLTPEEVPGSGKDGRITRFDVIKFLKERQNGAERVGAEMDE
jgi:pyruvate/2-oxoglutarate dehydrogenase complex dihydrolipoamide acyltransferase (E2) component